MEKVGNEVEGQTRFSSSQEEAYRSLRGSGTWPTCRGKPRHVIVVGIHIVQRGCRSCAILLHFLCWETFNPFVPEGLGVPGCGIALPGERRRLGCGPFPPTMVWDTPFTFLELRGTFSGLGFNAKSVCFSFIICSWIFLWSCCQTKFFPNVQ